MPGARDDLEAPHPAHVLDVSGRGHRIVLDDERADHDALPHRQPHHEHRARLALLDTHRATRPPHGPADERETQSAGPTVPRLLRAPAAGERALGRGRVEPRPAVGDPQHRLVAAHRPAEGHPARGGRRAGGVDRVVEQVPDDRDEVARVGDTGGHLDVVVDPDDNAALARLGGLAEHQGGQLGARRCGLTTTSVSVLPIARLRRGEPATRRRGAPAR